MAYEHHQRTLVFAVMEEIFHWVLCLGESNKNICSQSVAASLMTMMMMTVVVVMAMYIVDWLHDRLPCLKNADVKKEGKKKKKKKEMFVALLSPLLLVSPPQFDKHG